MVHVHAVLSAINQVFLNFRALGAHQWQCAGEYHSLVQQIHKSSSKIMESIAHDDVTKPVSFLKKKKRSTYEHESELSSSVETNLSDEDNQPIQHDDHDTYFNSYAEGYLHSDDEHYFDKTALLSSTSEEENLVDQIQYNSSVMPQKESKSPHLDQISIPPWHNFQIDLAEILGSHRTDLTLFDEITGLVKKHSNGKQLKFAADNLKNKKGFITKLENTTGATSLKPNGVDVTLSNGEVVTVSVFGMEAMISSLMHDENLMKDENLAPGYDLFTGMSTDANDKYGEIHTGDAWEPARQHFCGDHPQNMPMALVLFGDKSHFDLHGSLSSTPISFTLSCFNESARNRVQFWRPMSYLPNLSHGKVGNPDKSDRETSTESVYDEHRCISAALQSIVKVSKSGGIAMKVKGKAVIGKVWIHFIIGDCSGNNRLLCHFNGSGKLKQPYCDCKCGYHDMDDSNPNCKYITPNDVMRARKRKRKRNSKTSGKREMGKY